MVEKPIMGVSICTDEIQLYGMYVDLPLKMKGQRTVTPLSSKMMAGGNRTLPSEIRDAV